MIVYVLGKHLQPSQTFISNEIEEMRRQGVEVEVVAVQRGEVAVDGVTYLAELRPGRRRVVRDNLHAAVANPLGYLTFVRRAWALRSELGRRVPSLVRWYLLPGVARGLRRRGVVRAHAHFAWQGAAAAALLAPLARVPWSVTLHANDIFSKQRNLQAKLAMADTLVTVCRYNEAWMREHLGLKRDVHQVVCGVEVPEQPWLRKGDADVVVVGRLVPKKGVDTLIRAVDVLRSTHPEVRVDVVGDGPLRQELASLVSELGLESNVRFLGGVDHDEAMARIAGSRVFALPCRIAEDGDRDSMPVVIKEAMVRGVPVVASDVVAVPEMLSDGCGLMVPPDDPQALAAALDQLLSDPDLAVATAQRARTRALERFTLTSEVAKLRALLVPQTGPTPMLERRP